MASPGNFPRENFIEEKFIESSVQSVTIATEKKIRNPCRKERDKILFNSYM